MLVRNLALFFLVMALAVLLVLPAGAAQMTLEQAELPINAPNQIIAEINPDNAGNLIVSHEYGQIWKINPLNNSYTYYDVDFPPVTDAHWDGASRYWFTDSGNQISNANPSLNSSYTWAYDSANSADYQFGALAVQATNRIWLANSFGSGSKLYLFKFTAPSTGQMCPLTGGDYTTYAYDLVMRDNNLWFFNWYDEKISRLSLSPNEEGPHTLTTWTVGPPTPLDIIEGRVLAFDAHGRLWIPGGASGSIIRFDPASEKLFTYSVPSGTPSIEGVAVIGNLVYYADHRGSVGVLNPGLAARVESEPVTTSTVLLSPQCDTKLGSLPSTPFYETQEGFLAFTEQGSTPDTSHTGWTIYPLSTQSELYGIGVAQGRVFISDSRMEAESVRSSWLLRLHPENAIFLPLILK